MSFKNYFLLELSLLADICSCFLHLDSGIFRHLIWKTRQMQRRGTTFLQWLKGKFIYIF